MSGDRLWAPAERFRHTAGTALDVLMEHDPVWATLVGDHRQDHRLPDLGSAGVERQVRELSQATGALDDLDDTALDAQDLVDLELLRTRLTASQWTLTELAEQRWNPLLWLPGDAVYSLVARDTGEPDERARCLAERLRAVPAWLELARGQLGGGSGAGTGMPRVHVETAVTRARGAVELVRGPDVEALLARAPARQGEVARAAEGAVHALQQHADWLAAQVGDADRDPRLGHEAFAARLWWALDTHTGPDALLDRAESDLMAIEDEIDQVAARVAPRLGVAAMSPTRVRDVLDALAASAPVGDHDVLERCRVHLAGLEQVVRRHQLVSVPPGGVEVIEMPQVRRGVAVAYCDPPGALEPERDGGPLPTFFAVSPTPEGWSPEQVASFYREYNDHMLRDLAAHEAMPGHVLQLAHARRFAGSTPVRAALWSGAFVEGWAVYAEQLVADAVAAEVGDELPALALRMQQLKMRLRCTINAVLDVRVHTRGMTQDEAMLLMTGRGHQEAGEAAGKWRRALLSSAQLSTYYVGYAEVSALASDLAAARPGAPVLAVHDELLSHGSPSPRLLRALLDLP